MSEKRPIPLRPVLFLTGAAAAWGASLTGAVGDPVSLRVVGSVLGVMALHAWWMVINGRRTGPPSIQPLANAESLESFLSEERALLFKHSTACPVSSSAQHEVRRFAEAHPGVPIYQLRVIEERALSDEAARRLEVSHQSPQLILANCGVAEDELTHGQIRIRSIQRMLGLPNGG